MEINFDRKKKPKENEICIKKLKKMISNKQIEKQEGEIKKYL